MLAVAWFGPAAAVEPTIVAYSGFGEEGQPWRGSQTNLGKSGALFFSNERVTSRRHEARRQDCFYRTTFTIVFITIYPLVPSRLTGNRIIDLNTKLGQTPRLIKGIVSLAVGHRVTNSRGCREAGAHIWIKAGVGRQQGEWGGPAFSRRRLRRPL